MRTLVAGLGNIFHGDDGVGCAVAAELAERDVPAGAIVRDFGIRGVHLAYELLDGYDLVVIIDAVQRGGPPGAVHVIEHAPGDRGGGDVLMDAHDLAPDDVLALVPSLGGTLGRVVVVGCEDGEIAPGVGLSPAVAAGVGPAADAVLQVLEQARAEVAETDPGPGIRTGIGGGR